MTDLELLTPRDVPLGGPRAMTVRRTLPQRHRSLVGAWCFLDHYGPDDVAETGGMVVAPHPHTGLQTVSWLFTGEIEHRDSAGNVATVRPGEVNLMTAGHGISHSEVSTSATTVLHGAQLWVALPAGSRDTGPGFVHHVPDPVRREGLEARVFLGSLLGVTSPVATHTPLLGAELLLDPGATAVLDVDPAFEHGLLVDAGSVAVGGSPVGRGELGYLPTGSDRLELRGGREPTRLLVIGGPPFGEQVVMWWNFLGSSHEEVVAAREAWQAQVVADDDTPGCPEPHPDAAGGLPERPAVGQRVVPTGEDVRPGRFGVVPGQPLPPIPAPPLPNARLRARG